MPPKRTPKSSKKDSYREQVPESSLPSLPSLPSQSSSYGAQETTSFHSTQSPDTNIRATTPPPPPPGDIQVTISPRIIPQTRATTPTQSIESPTTPTSARLLRERRPSIRLPESFALPVEAESTLEQENRTQEEIEKGSICRFNKPF
jgi:hypothetical protein